MCYPYCIRKRKITSQVDESSAFRLDYFLESVPSLFYPLIAFSPVWNIDGKRLLVFFSPETDNFGVNRIWLVEFTHRTRIVVNSSGVEISKWCAVLLAELRYNFLITDVFWVILRLKIYIFCMLRCYIEKKAKSYAKVGKPIMYFGCILFLYMIIRCFYYLCDFFLRMLLFFEYIISLKKIVIWSRSERPR